ncbi:MULTISPECIES: hypothetical protein [unclassified Microcoleus]
MVESVSAIAFLVWKGRSPFTPFSQRAGAPLFGMERSIAEASK